MTGDVVPSRTGAELVVDTLERLGCDSAVGLPGQHALALFDALGRSNIRFLGARIEHNAGFAADGAARVSGKPVPLLLSAGPGALAVLSSLQEAHDASSPVLVIAAQVPVRGIGGHRHGYLHELADQSGHFAPMMETFSVRAAEQIPSVIAEAWGIAASTPHRPVYVEVPSDVLTRRASASVPTPIPGAVRPLAVPDLTPVIHALDASIAPVIYAGGGVVRGDAAHELVALAEALNAPVVTTFGGRSAFPFGHRLSAGGWIEDIATTELLETADVLLAVGTGLGELSTNYGVMAPRALVIQIDADDAVLGANYPVLGVNADAKAALGTLAEKVARRAPASDPRIDELKKTVESRLSAQGVETERSLLRAVRDGTPAETPVFFDMTILGYWSWSEWDARGGVYECAQSGGLGWALGAAMGASFVSSGPVLAVSGDGGAMYGISELATIVQHELPVTWLIIDDGGYGVLKEYLMAAYGRTTATDLVRPSFVALAESFGISAVRVDASEAGHAVHAGIASGRPNLVIVDAHLSLFAPTHLDRAS